MNYKYISITIIVFLLVSTQANSQKTEKKDKSVYSAKKPGYYQNVLLKSIDNENITIKKEQFQFSMDFSNHTFPTDTAKYSKIWHNKPLNQGLTGTCWSFAGTSFIETETERITKKKVKLSEMFVVYWEYIERAKYFVETRGNMYFAEGSESNAVTKIIKKYGTVPSYNYPGKLPGSTIHNHKKMLAEMLLFLESVKANNNWNENTVVETIKSILNHYMGEPPSTIIYEGKTYTPKEFSTIILQIIPDNYFSFMSTKEIAYNQKGILDEPDNWWKCDDYYNLSLDDFMKLLNNSITKSYSIAICGDVSEPGYNSEYQIAIIPTFDIPSNYINEDSRQYRLENKSTTDDHCLHIVGVQNINGTNWYLIKDSGSGAFDGNTKGYRFYHEDYIKLKMMNMLIHKDAAKEFLNKIIK